MNLENSLMQKVTCPFCGKKIDKMPFKKWKYGKYDVGRFECVCGKKFNLYTSPKKEFTIPKAK